MISRFKRLAFALRAVMQERHAARQVIEDQQRLRRDVAGLGHAVAIARTTRQRLEVSHEIVGRVADEAARQRQAVIVRPRAWRARKCRAQAGEQLIAPRGPRREAAVDRKSPAVEPDFEAVAEADERIAREPHAALDALQQEARTEWPQLQVSRNRRVEVCCDVERQAHGH